MSKPYCISYEDLASLMSPQSEQGDICQRFALEDEVWGSLKQHNIQMSGARAFYYDADFLRPVRVRYTDTLMPESVSLCLAQAGRIEIEFPQVQAGLDGDCHHGMYVPEHSYDIITKRINVLHLEISNDYFLNLLSDSESWSADLKERIAKKELVMSGVGRLDLQLKRCIHELLHAPFEGSLQRMLLEAKVLEIVTLQLGQYARAAKGTKFLPSDRDLLVGIREYLDLTFQEEHSLQGLSRTFGINEFKLKKGFRENFQTTVFEYVFNKRMEHARQLLQSQALNVNEVARQVGYKNPNHFSTAFKKKFGVNPRAVKI